MILQLSWSLFRSKFILWR